MPTLDWIGKKAVIGHHREVPFHLLKTDEKLSVGEPGSGNLLIEGDNLLALKALLPYYAGKVKCIYIDPPYNTGNENWVYNDAVNSPEMRNWLGKVVGGEFEDLSRHDKWLCMMYPRLALLKELLQQDGVLLISISDIEIANLTHLIHEIFGEYNILATLIWEKGKKGDAKFFSVTHEYIVVVAKSKSTLIQMNIKWRKRKEGADRVLQHYNELMKLNKGDHSLIRREMIEWFKKLPKNDPARKNKHYNWSDDRGLYFPDNFHGPDDGRENRPRYDIYHPVTGKPCKKPSTGWRWEESRTLQALSENPPRIHFGPDESTIPCRKTYLLEVNAEPLQSVFYKDGRAATLELEQIIGSGKFQFPKDSEILAELIGTICGNDDLILDSFAGSGTTGHSVLKLNQFGDKKLRFILVEMDVQTCQQITRNRLSSVINGYKQAKKNNNNEFKSALGGGFLYSRLGGTLFDETGAIQSEVSFGDLAAHVFFAETGEPIPKMSKGRSPLLGAHNGVAVYLLYNGILGDKRANGGNVLTQNVLKSLPPHDGPKVIYGTGCRLGAARLKREGIVFKQIPYAIKVG